MDTNDCLTGSEINDGDDVVAIAMIPSKAEYGISIVSGAGTFAPPVSAISFPITGKYSSYTIDADDTFASRHFLQLTGCSEWSETKKFIDAQASLFFPREYQSDVRYAKILNKSSEVTEVEKTYYPMGWSFFKKDTWDFLQGKLETDDFDMIKNYLLRKLEKADFSSYDSYYDLLKDISFLSFDNNILSNRVMNSRESSYVYTGQYFMADKYFKDYDAIKGYLEGDFHNEYRGMEQIVNVYNTFRNYDKVIGVSSRLGSSSYIPQNDLIALALKQKTESLIQRREDGYLDDGDLSEFRECNNSIIDTLKTLDAFENTHKF